MHDRKASTIYCAIDERNGRRLVVILEYLGIVFRFIDKGQLDAVALELNGDVHFPARIAAGDVPASAANTTRRPPGSDRGNCLTRRLRQTEPRTPATKISLVEQSTSIAGGCETPLIYFRACELRSFFRANVYLRPASDKSP